MTRFMILILVLFGVVSLVAETRSVERFDTSGMPPQPTTFVE